FDTLDANLALGLPADARDYGAAVGILKDLGIRRVRLLSNNPEKARQLVERGIEVDELVPLVVGVGEFNEGYLDVKRDRMGHTLPSHEVLAEHVTAPGGTERAAKDARPRSTPTGPDCGSPSSPALGTSGS